MSTRGLFGVRQAGRTKGLYIPNDSYPEGFGKKLLERIADRQWDKKYLARMFDKLAATEDLNRITGTSCCKVTDAFDALGYGFDSNCDYYYEDNTPFIIDSLFCEYAYIIDLDTNMLEYYLGFQKEPQPGNPYGTDSSEHDYYPCKGMFKVPLSRINSDSIPVIIKRMDDVDEIRED